MHSISVLALLILAWLIPQMVSAQPAGPICAARGEVLETLTGQYGESPRSMGLVPPNRVVELFASEQTGTWTIIVTNAEGISCLMAAGHYFESISAAPRGPRL